jgi:hypothetical protein
MGTRLPSEGEVLIIPPAGKRVSRLIAPIGSAPFVPGPPARKSVHSKAGSERNAVQSECSRKLKSTIPNSHFPSS